MTDGSLCAYKFFCWLFFLLCGGWYWEILKGDPDFCVILESLADSIVDVKLGPILKFSELGHSSGEHDIRVILHGSGLKEPPNLLRTRCTVNCIDITLDVYLNFHMSLKIYQSPNNSKNQMNHKKVHSILFQHKLYATYQIKLVLSWVWS